jgi:hypothetical protein
MSITVYGCVAFPAGTITFENLETCLAQSACIVFTGDHAGQVALTLSGADDPACNDTFYGCVNFTTGKFQVEIPTDCCKEYGNDCSYCEVGKVPKYITLVITGVVPMPCCPSAYNGYKTNVINVNGTFILTQDPDDSCRWQLYEPSGNFGNWSYWNWGDCTYDPYFTAEFPERLIEVKKLSDSSVVIHSYFHDISLPLGWILGFRYSGNATFQFCVGIKEENAVSNQIYCYWSPPWNASRIGGIEGIAWVCEGSHPEGCP